MIGRPLLAALLAFPLALPCLAGQAPSEAPIEKGLAEATKRLASTKVSIEADKQDPDKVLDIIRDASSVNIVVDPAVRRQWETQPLTLKLNDVSALSAFYHVLHNLDLNASYSNEAFIVNPPDKYEPTPQVSIFDIRDLTTQPDGNRLPPTLFGAQVDPLYYWYRGQLGAVSPGYSPYDPFAGLELLDTYPPDPIGHVIAETVGKAMAAKHPGVSVSYLDGYLVVVEQPKAARLPITPDEQAQATAETTKK
ncbi:MAG: hypothetical protein ACODAJ_03695 [Planctomycetota bacterium]